MKKKKKSLNKKFNKSEKISDNTIKYQQLRKEHNIWIWLILFCPVGIYKSIKYKCFSKPINVLLVVTLLLCVVLGLDNVLYPDRVIDYNIKKTFKSISDEYDLGTYRFGEKVGTIESKYIIYTITSTNGEYDLYFSDSTGKNISAIYSFEPEKGYILKSDEFTNLFKDIYPEILRLLTNKYLTNTYGEIQEIESTTDLTQTIKFTNGTFMFQVDKKAVISVYKINEDKSMLKVYNNGNNQPKIPPDISNYLKKNSKRIGDLGSIVSYVINEDNREYIIRMTNGNYHKLILYDNNTIEIYNAENNSSVNTAYEAD